MQLRKANQPRGSGVDYKSLARKLTKTEDYRALHWEGSFAEYLEIVRRNPLVARNAFQRLYDMVLSHGSETADVDGQELIRYPFFADPFEGARDGIFGLERSIMNLMGVFKAAAHGFGPEKRVLLLHGPVGSSKSTIVRLIKRGLEHYSRLAEGALYTFSWDIDGELRAGLKLALCMNDLGSLFALGLRLPGDGTNHFLR